MDIEKFEKDMAVFSDKAHHEALNYLKHLKLCGWSIEQASEWLEIKRTNKSVRQASTGRYTKICDDCKSLMYLQPVNSSRGDQTGDPTDTFVWFCSNQNCMNTIYIKDTEEQIKARGN